MIIFVPDGWSHMNASYVSAAEKKNGSVDYRCTTSIVRAFLSEKTVIIFGERCFFNVVLHASFHSDR